LFYENGIGRSQMFNLGAKDETLNNVWKSDVNFRDPQIQIHASTFLQDRERDV
jgi:hypothetical protein